MRDRLIELCENLILSCKSSLCEDCEHKNIDYPNCMSVHFADYLLANGVIVPPCKVGDKVAVRACCECVSVIPDRDECRYICPFEDDCECEECDNANEKIFNTTINAIFNNGFGWQVEFNHLIGIEANITDIGTSFFVGENAEQQAKEYEQKLKGGANDV